MLRHATALLVALVALATAAAAQTTFSTEALAARIDEVLDDEDFEGARWGAYAVDAESGQVLYARDQGGFYIPASNMKLVVTAAALDELGPDYRFRSRLYLDGEVRDDTLRGALVVRGGGDPRFGGRDTSGDLARAFVAWADSLRASGVRAVAGPILLADDAIDNPSAHVLRTLRRTLQREGVAFTTSEARVYNELPHPDYSRMRRVATLPSPRLSSFVGITNTDSNNLYSERILRTLATELFPGDGPVHPVLRARAPDAFLTRAGINPQSFTVADGSGLSRDNRLTPAGTVALLRWMWDHPDPRTQRAFMASLPVGGQSGTLRRRYASGDARGNVRAKTGYIRRVRTLSGYVDAANGRTVVFALMCNGYSVSTRRVNRAQDAVVELLADYDGRPQPPVRRSAMTGMLDTSE